MRRKFSAKEPSLAWISDMNSRNTRGTGAVCQPPLSYHQRPPSNQPWSNTSLSRAAAMFTRVNMAHFDRSKSLPTNVYPGKHAGSIRSQRLTCRDERGSETFGQDRGLACGNVAQELLDTLLDCELCQRLRLDQERPTRTRAFPSVFVLHKSQHLEVRWQGPGLLKDQLDPPSIGGVWETFLSQFEQGPCIRRL